MRWRGAVLGGGKVAVDSELGICVRERHVRSCTFPYCSAAGFFFFITIVAAEVTFTSSISQGFWMN